MTEETETQDVPVRKTGKEAWEEFKRSCSLSERELIRNGEVLRDETVRMIRLAQKDDDRWQLARVIVNNGTIVHKQMLDAYLESKIPEKERN